MHTVDFNLHVLLKVAYRKDAVKCPISRMTKQLSSEKNMTFAA